MNYEARSARIAANGEGKEIAQITYQMPSSHQFTSQAPSASDGHRVPDRHPRKDNKTITVQEHSKDAQGAEHDQHGLCKAGKAPPAACVAIRCFKMSKSFLAPPWAVLIYPITNYPLTKSTENLLSINTLMLPYPLPIHPRSSHFGVDLSHMP